MSDQAPTPVLAIVTNTWHLHPTKAMAGVSFMWRRGGLHSIATTAFNPGWEDPTYAVPMVAWTMLRLLGDQFRVPTTVYIAGEGDTALYANWPVVSVMNYRTEADDKLGGLVCIPRAEFQLVASKEKTS